LSQKKLFGVKTWQAGMRVEALDRKTPTLICVATVGMQTNVIDIVYHITLFCFCHCSILSVLFSVKKFNELFHGVLLEVDFYDFRCLFFYFSFSYLAMPVK